MATLKALKELQAAAEREAQGDKAARMDIVNGLQALQNAILTPAEKIERIRFQVFQTVCVRLAQEYGILQQLVAKGRSSAQQLAEATRAEELFIVRIMRLLTIIGVADEVGPRLYDANEMTQYCLLKGVEGDIKFYADMVVKVCSNMGPMARDGIKSDPYAYTFGKDVYGYLAEHREYGKAFEDFMTARREATWERWFDIFPAKERIADSEIGDVLLVDVGGGQGYWTEQFHEAFPNTPGSLIVQDRPNVLVERKGIDNMVYDFLTPQPVVGARFYYFKSILHNWNDDEGVEILKNTVQSMKKGYSTLLIDNYALPEEKVSLRAAYVDIAMLALFEGGYQRTEGQWKTLVEAAGLKLVKFWYPDAVHEGSEAIIECERI